MWLLPRRPREGVAFSLLKVCTVPACHCGDPALTAHSPAAPCKPTKLSAELRAGPSAGPGKETEVQRGLSSKNPGSSALPSVCWRDGALSSSQGFLDGAGEGEVQILAAEGASEVVQVQGPHHGSCQPLVLQVLHLAGEAQRGSAGLPA